MFVFKIADKADGRRTLERSPGQACDTCKQRKLKCDRLEPCGACQTTHTTCLYETTPRRRGRPPAGRRLRLEKQRLRSTSGLENLSPVSSAIATPLAASPRSDQAGHDELAASFATPVTAALPATDRELSSESVRGEASSEDSLHDPERLDLLTPELNPPESWQQVTEYPSATALNAHLPSSQPGIPLTTTRSAPEVVTQHPLSAFTHWTRVFIMRLYPVFPIVDPGCLLSNLSLTRDAVPRSMARFYAAMSAAVIVQLNIDVSSTMGSGNTNLLSSHTSPPDPVVTPISLADRYIEQCTADRQGTLFVEEVDEWTILESFFTFSYYGNRNKSKQAWYYLREAMGFALSLGLDREESYKDPDLEINERRRRLYWLLFVTERAYCLQHQTSAMLQASIALPRIYDGCDEATLGGFISLIMLFIHVDSTFLASWCTQSIKGDDETVSKFLNLDRFAASRHPAAIDETQRADISVTQCWLHTLSWRLRNQASIVNTRGGGSVAATSVRKAARSLLSCFSNTRRDAIESHGIGMEQKLCDIAGFMCDLLPTLEQSNLTAGTDSIPNLLHNFMCLLANFRNQESCYLGPLAERATVLLMLHGGGPSDYEPCLDLRETAEEDTNKDDGEEIWAESWEAL